MLMTLAAIFLPLLLVFGLYHLLTWFNIFNVNSSDFWRRVALASAISHGFLAVGFFIFSYFDYQASRALPSAAGGFDSYLFNGSEFWRLMLIFDTLPMIVLLALFFGLDAAGFNLPILVPLTIAVTLLIGTIQWYFVGGGVGALLERFWSGLKTGDDEDEDWF